MFVEALTSALLHSLWQITLLAVALWAVLQFIPPRRATTRYLASMAGLALVPLIFFATLMAGLEPAPTRLTAEVIAKNGFGNIALVSLWIAGVATVFVKRMNDWRQIKRIARQPMQAFGPQTSMRFDRLLISLRISKPIRAGFSACVSGPCTFGFFKPVILLPLSCLTHLGPLEIEAILAHELAHIKRADFLHKCLQSLIEALFFYHPGMKFICAQISTEREHACDDLAVAALGQTAPLARGLLKSGLIQQGNLLLRASPPDHNKLLQRVHRLTGSQKPARRKRGAALVLTLFMLSTIGGTSLAFAPGSNPFKTNPTVHTADLSQDEIVFMKDDICAIFKADGIYQDPKYGGLRVAANVVFSKHAVLMNGQALPPSTHKAVRGILNRYGITQSTQGHLRFFGPEVSLIL